MNAFLGANRSSFDGLKARALKKIRSPEKKLFSATMQKFGRKKRAYKKEKGL